MNVFLLQAPDELLDTMKDLQSCVDKAQEKKAKKKKKKQGDGGAVSTNRQHHSCATCFGSLAL